MARIYLAKAGGIGAFERYVVLKTISPDRANDPRFVTMFLDEARLAATLNHQNIAQVYEVDEADGSLFITMEYVHGENLRHILETTLRQGWTIPVELAVMIVSSASAGLHHAHERKGKNGQPLNIVHRDVSPANIMVGYDGSVKLLDFGIAKAEERSTKTQQGTIKGKYGYMSPEQCRGKPIDRRSDIFALGIVLYEITTLRRAYRGNDDFDTMKRIVNGDLVPPSVAVPGYPRELEAIVLTAMARDPDFRFQTTQEMLEALDAFMVRAKLSGSPSAMARFMTQLFGSKREPWVELAAAGLDARNAAAARAKAPSEPPADRTEITDDLPDGDSNAEATAVLEPADQNQTIRDQHQTLRDIEIHDTGTTQPTHTVGETLKPETVPWVSPRTTQRETGPEIVAEWDQPSEQPPRRTSPLRAPPDSIPPEPPRHTLTGAPAPGASPQSRRVTGAPQALPGTPAARRPSAVVPAQPAPPEPPALVVDPNEPVPSLRPNRTAMWILIVVVIAVVAVVAGSIALGLIRTPSASTSTPAPTDVGSGSARPGP